MLNIRTVLHPTDFSRCSDTAFSVACSLAQQHNAHLVLLHVAGPVTSGPSLVPDATEAQQAIATKLNALRAANPNAAISRQIRHGAPAEEIVRLARECKADVIVLGTHGRTGLARLLAGSVAEEVMRTAPCPVLAVRIPIPVEGSA